MEGVSLYMDTAQILTELRAERSRIDSAITALVALDGRKPLGNGHDLPTPLGKPAAARDVKHATHTVRRTMSPAARKKIAAALKARWAAKKTSTKPVADAKQATPKKVVTKTAKRVISAESRKKMAEAQKKRWAKKKSAARGAARKAAAVPVATAAAAAPKA
jgi:hypothetical protein